MRSICVKSSWKKCKVSIKTPLEKCKKNSEKWLAEQMAKAAGYWIPDV